MMSAGLYSKALAAAATQAGVGYASANADGVVTLPEYAALLVAALVAGVLVWAVPNSPRSDTGAVGGVPEGWDSASVVGGGLE